MPNEKGTEYMESGDIYQGDFTNGIKEGEGNIKFKNESTFTGKFCNDMINGYGFLIR